MIDFIFKPKGSRIWRWKFRQQSEDGKIIDISLETPDKRCAEKRREELRKEKLFERDGLLMPKPLREAAQRELSNHLKDFLGDLRRRGKSDKYLANLEYRVGELTKSCHWSTVKDITADSFQTGSRQNDGLAAKTMNDYLEAVRCLLGWLIKNGRAQCNPLQTVEKVKVVEDKTRQRRAFTTAEFCRLLDAVPKNRKAIYLMAIHTGLRRSELAGLKPSDIHLNAVVPFVQVRASTTKNGKAVTMRLHQDVVVALRDLGSTGSSDEPIFSHFPRIERFRRDLKLAGVQYRDDAGRVADFHSLRKTFCTNLANAGVASRVAMTLMRHSDRRLTDKVYTDENLLGKSSAIEAIPSYANPASQGASQRMVAYGQTESPAVTLSGGVKTTENPVNTGEIPGLAPYVTNGQNGNNGGSGGARTRNLCRDRAAL